MGERRITSWLSTHTWQESNAQGLRHMVITIGSERQQEPSPPSPPSPWKRMRSIVLAIAAWGLIQWEIWRQGSLRNLPNDVLNDLLLVMPLALLTYWRVKDVKDWWAKAHRSPNE